MTKFSGHRRWGPGSVSSKFGGDPEFRREAIARTRAGLCWRLPKVSNSYYRRLPAVGERRGYRVAAQERQLLGRRNFQGTCVGAPAVCPANLVAIRHSGARLSLARAPAEWGLLPKERHSYYRRLPAVGQAFTPRDDTCAWLSFHTSHPGSQTDRQTDSHRTGE